jgi:sulfite exporter TauE/SafE
MSIILSLFLTGILFGAGPCLISCGPVLMSYICGTNKTVRESLSAYTVFTVSRLAVYIVLSLCVFLIGHSGLELFMADYSNYVYILAGFFLMILGVYFVLGKRMELKPFNLVHRHIIKGDTKNVVLLGIAYGLLPCAPFLGVLSYIGLVSKSWMQNIFYAISFGAGTFVSPLLIVSLAAGVLPGFMKNKNGLMVKIVRICCGIIALYMGAQLVRRAFS